jgi:PAS domain S-box-containing protein
MTIVVRLAALVAGFAQAQPGPGAPPGGPIPANIWGFLGALIAGGGLSAIIATIAKATGWFERRRQDSISERDTLIDHLQAKIVKLNETIDKANGQVMQEQTTFRELLDKERQEYDVHLESLRLENSRLSVKIARLEGELRVAYTTMSSRILGESVDNMVDVVITANQDGIIVAVSPAVTFLLQYMPEQLIGKPITVLIPERFRELHREGFARIVRENRAPDPMQVICSMALRRDGEEIPIDLKLAAWKNKDSSRWVYCAVLRRSWRDDPIAPIPPESTSSLATNPNSPPPPVVPVPPPGKSANPSDIDIQK